jgi:hypothetical protein
VAEHPILFNGAMVRAILEGRKTVTRRVVDLTHAVGEPEVPPGHVLNYWHPGAVIHYGCRPLPTARRAWQVQKLCDESCQHTDTVGPYDGRHPKAWGPMPYWPGLQLWVRERQRVIEVEQVHRGDPAALGPALRIRVAYEADGAESDWIEYPVRLLGAPQGGKCLSYGGFRESSRLTLNVASVRIERLHELTGDESLLEGIEPCE